MEGAPRLALKLEDGAVSLGMQAASRHQKRQRNRCSLGAFTEEDSSSTP